MIQKSDTNNDQIIGGKIRHLRNLAKMTQKQLGEKVELSSQQIQKYEIGVNRVSSVLLKKFADIFKVDINFFFDLDYAIASTEELALNDDDAQYEEISEELAELIECFNNISDPRVKQQLLELAKTLSKI